MFTKAQLEQIKSLLNANNEQIGKTVREEIEAEVKKIRERAVIEDHSVSVHFDEIEDVLKNLQISSARLEKGQDELKLEQQA